jgi:glucose uptake protein
MSFFYRFVASAMDVNNFESPTAGMMTPYTAFFVFAMGILTSNFLFNTIIMKKPFVGAPVTYKDYFQRKPFNTHGRGNWGVNLGPGYRVELYGCR